MLVYLFKRHFTFLLINLIYVKFQNGVTYILLGLYFTMGIYLTVFLLLIDLYKVANHRCYFCKAVYLLNFFLFLILCKVLKSFRKSV